MGAIYLGVLAVTGYGIFLGIKNLIKLWKCGERGKKLFWTYIAFFLITPCIFTTGYYIIDESDPNLWLIAPLLLMAFMWMVMGYFVQSAYQQLSTDSGRTWRTKEKAKNLIMMGCSMFLIGFLIWLVGFFNGYPHWESALVVLSIFLILYGAVLVIRNFKYLKPKPKAKKQN